jgi:hypothetical protein
LAIIQPQPSYVDGCRTRHRSDMQLLEPVHVVEGKPKAFALLGGDELIDIDRMNRLFTVLIATTVAQRLPASGQTG